MDPISNQSMRMSGKYRVTSVSMRSATTTKPGITRGQWPTTTATRGPRPIPLSKKLLLILPPKCCTLVNALTIVGMLIRSGHRQRLYLSTTKSIIDSRMITAETDSNLNGFHFKTGTGEMSIRTTHKISYSRGSRLVSASTLARIPRTITDSSSFGVLLAWYGLTACMWKIKFVDMTFNIWKSSAFDSVVIYFYYILINLNYSCIF